MLIFRVVLILFYEMRVFSQMRFFNDFLETSKGKKRTWANPMSSKQCNPCTKVMISLFGFRKRFFVC